MKLFMTRKNKVKNEAQSKIYEKYQEMMKKSKKYYVEGAVIDGLRYESMAEAYFEGAADMLLVIYPDKSISKDKWTITL